MKHILLAEDDIDFGNILKQYLEISVADPKEEKPKPRKKQNVIWRKQKENLKEPNEN